MRFWLLGALTFSGCAHSFYYNPEIAGEGARVGRGGIVFQVPPQKTELKIKIMTSGITKAPDEARTSKGGKMVQVRMLFVRTAEGSSASITVEPSDMKLLLPGGSAETAVFPALVHGGTRKGNAVQLNADRKQAIDFWFPLPESSRGARDYQYYTVAWRVHYGSSQAGDQTRFDRQDGRPQQGAEMFPWDSDFPFDLSPVLPPGWVYEPWPWWEPFPFWP